MKTNEKPGKSGVGKTPTWIGNFRLLNQAHLFGNGRLARLRGEKLGEEPKTMRRRDEELAKARRKARAHRKHIRQLERCLKEEKSDASKARKDRDFFYNEMRRLEYELRVSLEDRDEQVADLENLLVSCGYFKMPTPTPEFAEAIRQLEEDRDKERATHG